MTFAELLGLADPQRTTLELSPEHDAALLVDMDGKITGFLEQRTASAGQSLQAVIQGEFGTGKTHVLRYVEKVLAPRRGYHPLYIELGGFGSRPGFLDLHIRVMNVLLDWLEELLRRSEDLDGWLQSQRDLNEDMKSALRALKDTADKTKRALLRAWFIGTGPTPTDARRKLGLSGRLNERAGPVELVNLWKSIGELTRAVEQRTLLLLIDEGETFQRVVHPESQAAMGSGLRRLFDADNRSLGILLGLNTPESRMGLHPMLRHDVRSRLQGKELQLEPLGNPERIRRFIELLWEKLRAPDARTPLFTEPALVRVSSELDSFRDAITTQLRGATTLTTQRDVVRVLAFMGERAYSDNSPPPVEPDRLKRWFGI